MAARQLQRSVRHHMARRFAGVRDRAEQTLDQQLLEQLQAGGGALTGLQALDGLTRPAAPERLQRRMGMGQPCGAFAQQQRCGAGRELRAHRAHGLRHVTQIASAARTTDERLAAQRAPHLRRCVVQAQRGAVKPQDQVHLAGRQHLLAPSEQGGGRRVVGRRVPDAFDQH